MLWVDIPESAGLAEVEDGILVEGDHGGDNLVDFSGEIAALKADDNLLVQVDFHYY